MHRRGFIKSIALVAVAVIVIGVVFYYLIPPNIGWPVESRRFVHPAGFSIIQPLDWERHIVVNDDTPTPDYVRLLPAKPVGPPGFLMICKMRDAQDEAKLKTDGYKATIFQGQPAWEFFRPHRATDETTREIIFQRNNVWFLLSVRRPNSESLVDGIWPKYLDSFRVEPVRQAPVLSTTSLAIPLPAATAPTTAPSP